MHARVNIIFGRTDLVEDGISHLEESDRVAVEATDGNRGLTTLADRAAGVVVAVSYWDEPVQAAAGALTRARADAVTAAGGDLVVENFEVASQELLTVPAAGAVVRMVRVRIELERLTDAVRFVHDEVLRRLRVEAGFCSAELMVDRESGSGLLLAAWTGEEAATRTDTLIDRVRAEARARAGTTFPRSETYAVTGTTT
jgi:hypothetical protein